MFEVSTEQYILQLSASALPEIYRPYVESAKLSEIDLAAYTTSARKLWTTFVDPPWDYRIEGESIAVTDCRETRTFHLHQGPA